MDAPYDLGGRSGYGPVPVGRGRAWSEHWEGLAYALGALVAQASGINNDALRHAMDTLDPELYRTSSPAGRWLAVAQRCAIEAGLVDAAELADRAARRAGGLSALDIDAYPEPVASRAPGPAPAHSKRDPPAGRRPRFAVGDRVRVDGRRSTGHTRLPGYLRGCRGEVVADRGFWVFPDRHAHGQGEAPTFVYAVRFAAGDIWPGAGTHHVHADLFEPYLEPTDA
ncbi:MAG: nitrile hydratase subunit beta [Acidimicrobiia bacterium]|nr:nitrile hydratase subunit beta [Acidimicrobiia bacterium]